jgi:hypothetical protein
MPAIHKKLSNNQGNKNWKVLLNNNAKNSISIKKIYAKNWYEKKLVKMILW